MGENRKKVSVGQVILAVLASIFLIPIMLMEAFAGGAIQGSARLFQTKGKQELFSAFEESGGVDWLTEEIQVQLQEEEKKVKIELLEKFSYQIGSQVRQPLYSELMEKVKKEVTEYSFVAGSFPKEEVSEMLYGILDSVLAGEIYRFEFTVQAERVKTNVERFYETSEVFRNLQVEQKEQVAEGIEQFYHSAESELNARMEEAYQSGVDLENGTTLYFAEVGLAASMLKTAGAVLLGALVVAILLLLCSFLFRASGFFTAGAASALIGILMVIAAQAAQQGVTAEALRNVTELPASVDTEAVAATLLAAFRVLYEGIRVWGISMTAVGGVLIVLGAARRHFACQKSETMI